MIIIYNGRIIDLLPILIFYLLLRKSLYFDIRLFYIYYSGFIFTSVI